MGMAIIETLEASPSAITRQMSCKGDADHVLNDLSKMKKLLKAADAYHEYAKKYVAFEVRTYVDFVNLPGDISSVNVSQDKKMVLNAINAMSDTEREALARECEETCTSVFSVLKRRKLERSKDNASASAIRESSRIIEEFDEKGETILEIKAPHGMKYFSSVFDAMENRTKDRLLKRGAVCIGGKRYVDPSNWSKFEDLKTAFEKRAVSIRNDVLSADSLISKISKYDQWKESLGYEYEWIFALISYFNASERVQERMRDVFAMMAYQDTFFDFNAPEEYVNKFEHLLLGGSDVV